MKDFTLYKNIFDNYTNSFLEKADSKYKASFEWKILHSNNVCRNAERIAKSENLDSDDVFIAQLCGLFHDIGRFKQYAVYHIFKDTETLYHGDLGVEVIKENGFFDNLDNATQNIIFTAIHNHGLYKIDACNSEKELFFSKLIRDADKIDIFAKHCNEIGTKNMVFKHNLSQENFISPKVLEDFLDKKLILKTDLQTLNDFKLMQLSWIFDLNFDFSKTIISEKKHINFVLETMENCNQIIIIKEFLNNHFKIK